MHTVLRTMFHNFTSPDNPLARYNSISNFSIFRGEFGVFERAAHAQIPQTPFFEKLLTLPYHKLPILLFTRSFHDISII